MSWFDITIIIILAGFAWYGFFFGLIRVIGNLVGLIIGAFIANKIYLEVFDFVDKFLPGSVAVGKIIVFVLCFTIISRLIGWVFTLLEKAFNLASIIPFLKTANRILGLVFSLLEGVLAIGIAVYILDRHLPSSIPLVRWLDVSTLSPYLIKISKILAPLLPEIYNRLKAFI